MPRHQPLPGRRRAAGWLVPLVLVLLLTGASATLGRPLGQPPASAALDFVAVEGYTHVRVDARGTTIVETAYSRGGPLISTGPNWAAFASDDVDAALSGAWLRQVTTHVGSDGVHHGLVLYRLTEAGVVLVGVEDRDGIHVRTPGQLVLPADPRIGTRWHGAGTTRTGGKQLPYSFDARVRQAASPEHARAGCIVVVMEQTVAGATGTTEHTWCPGRGVVEDDDAQLPPVDPGLPLGDHGQWDPATWQPHETDLNANPPQTWFTVLPTASRNDLVVLAHQSANDLILVPGQDVAQAIRVHPGGVVTSVSRFGELVVATTTHAKAVAYTTDGVRRWSVGLADITTMPPVLRGDELVFADASGDVTAVRARTGAVAWGASLGDQASTQPILCRDKVVFPTTAATLVALGEGGEEAWQVDVSERPGHLVCVPSGVVSSTSDQFEFIDDDGTYRRSVPIRDTLLRRMQPLGDGVVTVSDDFITAYDANLRPRWRVAGDYLDAFTRNDVVLALDATQLVALDASGRLLAHWATGLGGEAGTRLSATEDGAQVVSGGRAVTWHA